MRSLIRQALSRFVQGRATSGRTRSTDTVPRRRTRPAERPARPRLIDFHAVSDAVTLVFADVPSSDRGAPGPVLVLRARASGLEVHRELVERSDGWSVVVSDDDLADVGSKILDVWVETGTEDGTAKRSRIGAGVLRIPSRPGARRRWYVTTGGNLSVRRPSPMEVIAEAGVFDVDFYRSQVPELPPGADPIEHYVTRGAAEDRDPSAMFDTSYYRALVPTLRRRNPLADYCERGWKELRNPSPQFSTWWYWSKHLDPSDESINPLAHYEAVGKHKGLSTRPNPAPLASIGAGHRLAEDRAVRRICMFAGYDPDGVVDDYVVDYVAELARFADVYYLADSAMPATELEKLAEHTRGAWGERHGEYDFGSYARLAGKVGWATIEQYDELLMVNDSGYLLRPLDEVFARMTGRSCDWWALQSTKGTRQTRHQPVNQFREPIPMETVRSALLDEFETDDVYDFHLGSYFLAFRSPVVNDPEFRRYLSSVTIQERKRVIVHKYEIGLTHWLIQHGHALDTFIPRLYPFHPIFTRWYFRLLDEGFPLLKRYFLAENHYRVPGLLEWPELVRARLPDLDVSPFERNLARVTEPQKLSDSLRIGEPSATADDPVPDALLTAAQFVEADARSPKHADWWVFPVCPVTGAFTGTERAVFEQVKNDPTVHKIILTRDREIALDGVNVEAVPLDSPEGQHRLMRAGTILVRLSRDVSVSHPVSGERHNLIQVEQPEPLGSAGYAAAASELVLERIAEDQARVRAVLSTSTASALAATATCYPLTIHQVWTTGLPRNDFILRDENHLPADLMAELTRLRTLVGHRRLVLFMPVGRDDPRDGRYRFSSEELAWWRGWLEAGDYVLGVRESRTDSADSYRSQFAGLGALDLSDAEFAHVEMLYRVSVALIGDYSSAPVDYLLTGNPSVSFAYDHESYLRHRSARFDLDRCLPAVICRSFAELSTALEGLGGSDPSGPSYVLHRRLFVDHVDDDSAARVVAKIRDLTTVRGIGKWPGEHIA
jgi:hypothetical protein